MYMTVVEFRKNIAHYLDKAVAGETVTIVRRGIVFELKKVAS